MEQRFACKDRISELVSLEARDIQQEQGYKWIRDQTSFRF
jgi:site-specific recombinase XerD